MTPVRRRNSWRALFSFLYTGEVNFAPLKSQGSEARIHHISENTNPVGPPLCSPKSVCYLARKVSDRFSKDAFLHNNVHQLGLEDLEDIALEDVVAKTSATNVVRETFSKSTAR